MFSGDSSEPGNRCRLTKRQAVLLALTRDHRADTQVQLETIFGIDQTTVSRYIRFIQDILEKILPTAKKVLDRLASLPPDRREELLPGNIVMLDGTHLPVQRPQDKDVRKKAYSGKKKSCTANTTIMTNRDGLIIYAGPARPGSTHDLTILRQDDPDLGVITRSMKNPRTPKDRQVIVYADLGYQGIKETYPGIILKQPIKKPRGGKLTRKQKAYNKKISSTRVTVEHSIGKLKRSEILTRPYDGTLEQLSTDVQVASGLANFHMLWDNKNKKLMHGF